MSRNGDSRQSASSDQICQHISLVHHSLSPCIAGLTTKETEQPLQLCCQMFLSMPPFPTADKITPHGVACEKHTSKQETFLKHGSFLGNFKMRHPEGNAVKEGKKRQVQSIAHANLPLSKQKLTLLHIKSVTIA